LMDFLEKIIGSFLGGIITEKPGEIQELLSPLALRLIDQCFKGIPDEVFDCHNHIIGSESTGCKIHEFTRKPIWHPYFRTKMHALLTASGVKNETNIDAEYIERLVDLIQNNQKFYRWGKHLLLPLDNWYNEEGKIEEKKTGIYVPNEYVAHIVEKYPTLFENAVSIHPYRKDALEELNVWGRKGIKVVKWLPPEMGMDPSHKLCIPFYDLMKKHNMVLLTHTGKEQTIDHPWIDNSLGNPLLLRKPLEREVKVIAAHAASLGSNHDFEEPKRNNLTNFKLLMKLFDDPQYKDILYTDLSAITEFTRIGDPLSTLLDRTDLHNRILYGSDYPLPAVKVTIITRALSFRGYITEQERLLLNEVYGFNPCLFDFMSKKLLKSPSTGNMFLGNFFTKHSVLV